MFFYLFFFFFNDTATTEIYTLSLHDALPISSRRSRGLCLNCSSGGSAPASPDWDPGGVPGHRVFVTRRFRIADRKSTRLNSSHSQISYAVFCLKKKKNTVAHITR